MEHFYVEIAGEFKGREFVRPTIVKAPSIYEWQEVVETDYPHSRIISDNAAPLSKKVQPLFTVVEQWDEGEQAIPMYLFQHAVRSLLEEGKRIGQSQLDKDRVFLSAPKAMFAGADIETLHELLGLDSEVHGGAEFVVFPHRNEALGFMAILLREGIAQRIREVVQAN